MREVINQFYQFLRQLFHRRSSSSTISCRQSGVKIPSSTPISYIHDISWVNFIIIIIIFILSLSPSSTSPSSTPIINIIIIITYHHHHYHLHHIYHNHNYLVFFFVTAIYSKYIHRINADNNPRRDLEMEGIRVVVHSNRIWVY